MSVNFIDAVRKAAAAAGAKRVDKDVESFYGSFLVAYSGRLYEVQGDFQIGRLARDYQAIGSGGEVASGAMAALVENTKLKPKRVISKSLSIASELTPYVRPPFVIREQRKPKGERTR